jgi:hypothetical protein
MACFQLPSAPFTALENGPQMKHCFVFDVCCLLLDISLSIPSGIVWLCHQVGLGLGLIGPAHNGLGGCMSSARICSTGMQLLQPT